MRALQMLLHRIAGLHNIAAAVPTKSTRQRISGEASTPSPNNTMSKAFLCYETCKRQVIESVAGVRPLPLDPDVVRRDDICQLGKWLYGSGASQFGLDTRFQRLKLTHTALHLSAADALEAASCGKVEDAWQLLEHGEFAEDSVKLQQELVAFFSATGDRPVSKTAVN